MTDGFLHDEIIINSNDEVGHADDIRQVIFPSFEIFSSPTIRIDDVKRRRFPLIDRAVQKAKAQIMAQEDADIFAVLDSIGKND